MANIDSDQKPESEEFSQEIDNEIDQLMNTLLKKSSITEDREQLIDNISQKIKWQTGVSKTVVETFLNDRH